MSRRKNSAGKLNLVLLISTLISAVLTGLGMHFSYGIAFVTEKDNPLFMPAYMAALFAVFFAITCLVVFVISNLTLTYRADVISGRRQKGRVVLYILVGMLLIGMFMFGAEYLYEKNLQKGSKGTGTYVFLIDNSGSMDISDPYESRYSVIKELLGDKSAKTQYTVYTFESDVDLQVPMQTVGEGFPSRYPSATGGTALKAGLERVISDCEQGVWSAENGATLILITDGDPGDFSDIYDISTILDRYVKQDIKMGIVGVIGANNDLMRKITTYTGGTFTDISDASLMTEAVTHVSGSAGRTRDLLGERDAVQMNWLYTMIRILAVALAGALIAVGAALCYCNNTVFSFMVWTNVIKAVLAGVLMEVAFVLPLSGAILRLVAWILLGTIITRCGSVDDTDGGSGKDLDLFKQSASGDDPFAFDF